MNGIAKINSNGIVTACNYLVKKIYGMNMRGMNLKEWFYTQWIMVELIICVRNQPPAPAQTLTPLSLHGTCGKSTTLAMDCIH